MADGAAVPAADAWGFAATSGVSARADSPGPMARGEDAAAERGVVTAAGRGIDPAAE
jgi:hypothetical protein